MDDRKLLELAAKAADVDSPFNACMFRDHCRAMSARIAELEAALRRHYEADKRLYEMPYDCEPADDIAALEEHDASFAAIGELLGNRATAAMGDRDA